MKKKDSIVQLETSKSSIKYLFNDLLNETKGFKYQITVKVLLKKYKPSNGEIEFTPVYFNSSTKTIINNRLKLEHAFQEILYRTDAWINNGSGWIIESIESQYINISTYRPLVGSYYIDLPIELNRIKFPVEEKDFKKIEVQNNIYINAFSYENEMVFPIYISDKNFEDSVDLLLLINNKSQYVYIKDFNTFMFHKTKNKNKKWFCKGCLQCVSGENILIRHKEDFRSINGVQSIDVEKGIIELENYFKQLPVPFKIYADFECNLRNVEIYEGSYTKNIMNMFLVVMLVKLFVLMIDLVSRFSKI